MFISPNSCFPPCLIPQSGAVLTVSAMCVFSAVTLHNTGALCSALNFWSPDVFNTDCSGLKSASREFGDGIWQMQRLCNQTMFYLAWLVPDMWLLSDIRFFYWLV